MHACEGTDSAQGTAFLWDAASPAQPEWHMAAGIPIHRRETRSHLTEHPSPVAMTLTLTLLQMQGCLPCAGRSGGLCLS